MSEVDLLVEITVAREAGGRDETITCCRREFRLPIRKSSLAQARGTQRFNAASGTPRPDEVVKVENTGSSEDASHYLAAGRMLGGQARSKLAKQSSRNNRGHCLHSDDLEPWTC